MQIKLIAGLCAVFGLGAWLGYLGAGSKVPEPQEEAARPTTTFQSRPDAAAGPATIHELIADTPTSLEDILRIESEFSRVSVLYTLAGNSDREQIERLLAELEYLAPGSQQSIASALYARFAELDPAAAVEHGLDNRWPQDPWVNVVFRTWARTDLAASVARARTLDRRMRSRAGRAILSASDDLFPDERTRIAAELGLSNILPQLAAQALLNVRDPEQAWRQAMEVEDFRQRSTQLSTIARRWGYRDPQAALTAINSIDDLALRSRLEQITVQQWAQKEPKAAMDWALSRPPSQFRTQMFGSALSVLAQTDARGAATLAENLTQANERVVAINNVLQSWAMQDPRMAAEWYETLDPAERRSGINGIARAYAQHDPREAFEWGLGLDGPESKVMMTTALNQIAQQDPATATRLLAQITDADSRRSATQTIAQNWARYAPAEAVRWAAAMDDAAERNTSLGVIYRHWANSDLEAALRYIPQIVDNTDRDTAMLSTLGNRFVDPDTAESLYNSISDEVIKKQATPLMYRILQHEDPSRAEQYRTTRQDGITTVAKPGFPPSFRSFDIRSDSSHVIVE